MCWNCDRCRVKRVSNFPVYNLFCYYFCILWSSHVANHTFLKTMQFLCDNVSMWLLIRLSTSPSFKSYRSVYQQSVINCTIIHVSKTLWLRSLTIQEVLHHSTNKVQSELFVSLGSKSILFLTFRSSSQTSSDQLLFVAVVVDTLITHCHSKVSFITNSLKYFLTSRNYLVSLRRQLS